MAQISKPATVLQRSAEGSKFARRAGPVMPALADHNKAAGALIAQRPQTAQRGAKAPAQQGSGTPTLANHIDAAEAMVQGSSRGDIGNMPMGEYPPAWEKLIS